MIQGSRLAKRYARALFAALDESQSEVVRVALQSLAEAWEHSKDFRQNVTDPIRLPEERTHALLGILETTGLLDIQPFKALLELLVQRKRAEMIPALAADFALLCDERNNARSFVVSTPRELTEDEKRTITDRLSQKISGPVFVEWIVDEDMIAGLQIRSGDKLIDRSLGGALARLAAHLTSNN